MSLTAGADRDALLRYLDLKNDIATIAQTYADLGPSIVAASLHSAAYEVFACMILPQRYVAPIPPHGPSPSKQPEAK